MSSENPQRGRCVRIDEGTITLMNEMGLLQVEVAQDSPLCRVGDIIEISQQGQVKVLTPNRSPDSQMLWANRILDPRRQKALRVRRQLEDGVKCYFEKQGFHSVRTPTLVKSPGMEAHIRPYHLQTGEFLPTSPEFAMKKLLAGGLEKIFQICPAFRYEPLSPQHHPEFTILEWYRAYAGMNEIMFDVESLMEGLAQKILGTSTITYQGQSISFAAPWPRFRVRELFRQHADIDLLRAKCARDLGNEAVRLGLQVQDTDTWDDVFFKIWLNFIEKKLPRDQAVFVTHFPPSQSALSVIKNDSDGSPWAQRFEVYAGGLELGNAFEELTDPGEQRQRFQEEMELRKKAYGSQFPPNPIDEDFLHALAEGIPPSGGIAIGIDRLVMLLADEPDIDYTLWLKSYVAHHDFAS